MADTTTKIPRTKEEAANVLADIGELKHKIAAAESKRSNAATEATKEYRTATAGLQEQIDEKTAALRQWAEKHREKLLADGGKTVTLETGYLRWRILPSKLVHDSNEATTIAALKRRDLGALVVVRESVNVEAVLKLDAATLKGLPVKVEQCEGFQAAPLYPVPSAP